MNNDAMNIIRKVIYNEKINMCNKQYRDLFQSIQHSDSIYYIYNPMYSINFRKIYQNIYRKHIACFKDGLITGKNVPKNY